MPADDGRVRRQSQPGPGTAAQLFGFGGGMVAYAVHLLTGVTLVPASCAVGSTWPVHAATVVAVTMIALSAVAAWRVLLAGRILVKGDAAIQRRRRFLGGAGLLLNGLALLPVLYADVPNHLMNPCVP